MKREFTNLKKAKRYADKQLKEGANFVNLTSGKKKKYAVVY